MNWWIFKPTLIPNCQLYCLSVVLRALVSFNQLVTDHKKELTERYNIINLTGDSSLNELSQNLFRVDYVTNLYQPLMELADIVVTRGGANTIFELLAMAKLHVIVPLGREASRGDQIENAAYFVKKGYAEELQERRFDLG